LSGGRFVFGVGIGWLEAEFAAVGARFATRARDSVEALRTIRSLLSEERPVDGSFGFAPKPVQRPWPPIWIGGESRGALQRVAELGDAWHPGSLTPDELAPRLDELRAVCSERGRSYDELEITVRVLRAKPFLDAYVDDFATLGVSELVFDPAYEHTDVDAYLDEVRAYARLIA
jgi:alkanesulfonate monooxygenase SsuD/methylene tetrahydromethanopterin reductase-like flavin-dependent oxidoreductase (luciferase family)